MAERSLGWGTEGGCTGPGPTVFATLRVDKEYAHGARPVRSAAIRYSRRLVQRAGRPAGAVAAGDSPRPHGPGRPRRPGAAVRHGADQAGGEPGAGDSDPGAGARDLPSVATDAADPRASSTTPSRRKRWPRRSPSCLQWTDRRGAGPATCDGPYRAIGGPSTRASIRHHNSGSAPVPRAPRKGPERRSLRAGAGPQFSPRGWGTAALVRGRRYGAAGWPRAAARRGSSGR